MIRNTFAEATAIMPPSKNSIRSAVGPTILLGSGKYFDYDDFDGTELSLEDIAYGLAFTSRFSGQCVNRKDRKRTYYSVAQHCEIMSRIVPEEMAYPALMHECAEAICGDINTPLKSKIPAYRIIEKACEKKIFGAFLVGDFDHLALKVYDVRMWATERRDLMNWDGRRWNEDDVAEPFDFEISAMGPYEAAASFMDRFFEIAPVPICARFKST